MLFVASRPSMSQSPAETEKRQEAADNTHLTKSVQLQAAAANRIHDGCIMDDLCLDAQGMSPQLQICMCSGPAIRAPLLSHRRQVSLNRLCRAATDAEI